MIQVDEKERIRRLYFIKRHSIREIAKELHHSRKTIRKAIADASILEYRLTTTKPKTVMGDYLPIIENWLKEDKERPKKQRHTAHRIFERLVKEHFFPGAERTVRENVSKLRQNFNEMSIPLEFDPGADAQCDWGEAQVIMAGIKETVQIFCIKLSYSGKPFVMAFPTQRQEAFFEGHKEAFEWYEGVPGRISYDNMTIAVRKVLNGRNRIEQASFIAFRSHYLFESHFSNPRTPREQGRIENLVGYARRNYFVPLPEVSSYEELNHTLLGRLTEDDGRTSAGKDITIGEAWENEKGRLLPLPRFPHRCCVTSPVKVNRQSLVTYDGHGYSVPVEYGASKLMLHAYAWKIEIASGERVIAVHDRLYGKQKDAMKVEHYLPLLIRRPGAFPYAKPVRQWDMPEVYKEFLKALSDHDKSDGVKEFIRVLYFGRYYGQEKLEEAMKQALLENRADALRVGQILSMTDTPEVRSDNSPEYLGQIRVVLPDLSQFDRLRPVAAGERI